MIQLGTKEQPVTVTCDPNDSYNDIYIYVNIDEAQGSQIEALECHELDRITSINTRRRRALLTGADAN